MIKQFQILGVNISQINYDQLVDRARAYIAEPKGLRLIFTPNPEIIYASLTDPSLKEVLNQADINLPDGIGIILACKLLGLPIHQRVTGVDAFITLCRHKVGKVFLLGSKPGVADRAAKSLMQQYSGLQVVGQMDGYFKDNESDRVIQAINGSGADILFVGLGAPRQEKWLLANRDRLLVKVAMVMGGSLDVISGDKQRAPEFFIRFHIEWLYRLYQEPWRIKRMSVIPKFIYHVIVKSNFLR